MWRNVTREFSLDEPEVVRLGGDIGWLPLGSFDVYAETILSLEIGKVSAPITDIESPKVVPESGTVPASGTSWNNK